MDPLDKKKQIASGKPSAGIGEGMGKGMMSPNVLFPNWSIIRIIEPRFKKQPPVEKRGFLYRCGSCLMQSYVKNRPLF